MRISDWSSDVCSSDLHALLEEAAGRVEDFSSNMRGVVYRRLNGKPARLTHGGLLQVLATADPPAHTLHRRAVFPDLVAKRMAAMAPEIEQVADDCNASGRASCRERVGR